MTEATGSEQTIDPVARFWQTLCRAGAIKLLVGIAILVNCISIFSYPSLRHQQQDFAHYYASSKLWLEGQTVYGTHLATQYEQLGWTEFDEPIFFATNPPSLLMLFAPFASLDPSIAHTVWMLIQLLALAGAVWLVWRCLKDGISLDGFLFVIAIFLLLPFVKIHLYYSQVQLLVLAMVLFAHRLIIVTGAGKANSGFCGTVACVAVAIAGLIKIYPLALLPWFVWRSGHKMAGRIGAFLASSATLAIGVWLTDFQLWANFIESGLPFVATWVKAANNCFTIGSATHQIGALSTGHVDSDFFVRAGSFFGAFLFAAFYFRLVFRTAEPNRSLLNTELALLILLMLFCGGTCWWHYLVFLLFPMQVIADLLRDRLSPTVFAASFITVLLFANIEFPSTNIELLQTLLDQRPLIGMFIMAVFLAFNLKPKHPIAATESFGARAVLDP